MNETGQAGDLLDSFVGSVAISQLRARRPDIVRHSQGSHDVLVSPRDPGGLSLAERALIALRVAELAGHQPLGAHYRGLLDQRAPALAEAAPAPRLQRVLDHVHRLATAPGSATKAHVDALRDAGLSARDIVALAQIVAFVSYQARAAAGLALLAQETAA